MDLAQANEKILELEDKIKLKNNEIDNYKLKISEISNNHKKEIEEFNQKIVENQIRINDLQNINQKYFLRIMQQEENLGIEENIKKPKEEKYVGGLEFNDFIDKL